MPDPYERLSEPQREEAIRALRGWALYQHDKTEPVLRFLDGAALTAQDLLDEPPPPPGDKDTFRGVHETSRAWRHMLNLITVSMDHGESLEEIVGQLQPHYEYPA